MEAIKRRANEPTNSEKEIPEDVAVMLKLQWIKSEEETK